MSQDTAFARCVCSGCTQPQHDGMELCFSHAFQIFRTIDIMMTTTESPEPKPRPETPVVYYLMLTPKKIKIGTTKDLVQRLSGLRTDFQYVVALEQGSFDLEVQRHRQFAAERIGRREDFNLSPALEAHIRHLRENTYSDELLEMYGNLGRNRRTTRAA